eukprot:334725-Chlamydomonas_euryale.AAC.4
MVSAAHNQCGNHHASGCHHAAPAASNLHHVCRQSTPRHHLAGGFQAVCSVTRMEPPSMPRQYVHPVVLKQLLDVFQLAGQAVLHIPCDGTYVVEGLTRRRV